MTKATHKADHQSYLAARAARLDAMWERARRLAKRLGDASLDPGERRVNTPYAGSVRILRAFRVWEMPGWRWRSALEASDLGQDYQPRKCSGPTSAKSGSVEKVATLTDRAATGEDLFHAEDGQHEARIDHRCITAAVERAIEFRLRRGLSASEIARELGVSPTTVARRDPHSKQYVPQRKRDDVVDRPIAVEPYPCPTCENMVTVRPCLICAAREARRETVQKGQKLNLDRPDSPQVQKFRDELNRVAARTDGAPLPEEVAERSAAEKQNYQAQMLRVDEVEPVLPSPNVHGEYLFRVVVAATVPVSRREVLEAVARIGIAAQQEACPT